MLLILLFLTLLIAPAFALNTTFGVQGKILDGSTPLTDENEFDFKLYNNETNGTLLWHENRTVWLDADGIFSEVLGTNGSAISLNFSETYWLELVINDEIQEPRTRVAGTLFAASAQSLPWPNATIYGDLLPDTNAARSLGAPGLIFDRIYASMVNATDVFAAGTNLSLIWSTQAADNATIGSNLSSLWLQQLADNRTVGSNLSSLWLRQLADNRTIAANASNLWLQQFADNRTLTSVLSAKLNLSGGTISWLNVTNNLTAPVWSSPYANRSFIAFEPDGSVKMLLDPVDGNPPVLTSLNSGGLEPVTNNDTVLYITFDEFNSTQFLDRSSRGNNGTMVGGMNKTYGKLGWAGSFDGTDDYVDIVDVASLRLTTAGTWSAWIKPTATARKAMSKSTDGSTNGYEMELNGFNAGNVECGIIKASGNYIYRGTPYTPNVWTHVACVYDASQSGNNKMKLYINGASVAGTVNTMGTPDIISDAGGNLRIGSRPGTSPPFYNGSIDSVRIWNRSLTAQEVLNLYNKQRNANGNLTEADDLAVAVNSSSDPDDVVNYAQVDWYKNGTLNATTGSPRDSGTVLFLPFDENGTAYDYSGLGNNGSLQNGVAYTHESAMGYGAYRFDGVDDYVNVNNNSGLSMGAGDWSASAWVRMQSHPSFPCVVVFDGAGLCLWGGKFGVLQGSNLANATSSTLPLNTWSLLTATRTGTTYKVYINGVDTTGTTTNANWALGGKYYVGRGYSTNYVNGFIDEVRIWNRTLSAEEINQLYRASAMKGFVLNNSYTSNNEEWNASVKLWDTFASSAELNVTFCVNTASCASSNGTTPPPAGGTAMKSSKFYITNLAGSTLFSVSLNGSGYFAGNLTVGSSDLFVGGINFTSNLTLLWNQQIADNRTLTVLLQNRANQSDLLANASRLEAMWTRHVADNATTAGNLTLLWSKQMADNATVSQLVNANNATLAARIAAAESKQATDNLTVASELALRLSGLGTAGYLAQFATNASLNDSVVFQNGTSIGIGTPSPSSRLDVIGNITVNGTSITASSGITLRNETGHPYCITVQGSTLAAAAGAC